MRDSAADPRSAPRRLLIAEDDPGLCELVREVAMRQGFAVESAADAERFRERLARFQPTEVYLDLQLHRTDALELMRLLAECRSGAAVLLASGRDQRALQATERLGAAHGLRMAGILQKPFSLQQLGLALESLSGRGATLSDDEVRRAVQEGALAVHYQPRADLRSFGADSVEALVRWPHSEQGLLGPAEFLPAVERLGLCAELTDLVLRDALAQCRGWRDQGIEVGVAVNFWPHTLADEHLPARLLDLLRQHQLEPGQLTIETVEGCAMREPQRTAEVLTRLRIHGVRLSIDDFGTGYASLAELWRLPFNELKIDRTFVHEALTNREADTIVRALVDLGHNLGLTVVAEGVECAATWSYLRTAGCDVAQGYYLDPAMPPQALPRWLDRWRLRAAELLAADGR